jgi:hypothetical protein
MRLLNTGPFFLICFQLRSSSILTNGTSTYNLFQRERKKGQQFAAQWKNGVISVAGSSLLAACPTVFYDIEWKTVALIPLRAQAKLQTLKNRGTHKIKRRPYERQTLNGDRKHFLLVLVYVLCCHFMPLLPYRTPSPDIVSSVMPLAADCAPGHGVTWGQFPWETSCNQSSLCERERREKRRRS